MTKKESLLNTQMNQLGLGGAFNGWFFYPKSMKQKDVITLQEFISINPGIKINNDTFKCINTCEDEYYTNRGFKKSSTSWGKIKNLLIENKFTPKDWTALIPEKVNERGKFNDYSMMEKSQLLVMPIHRVTGAKATGPLQSIAYFFTEHHEPQNVLVEDILRFSLSDFEDKIGDENLRKTLATIQRKLSDYGFTKKDGRFMSSRFGRLDTQSDYIEELIVNKSFSKKDASTAVALAVKAGWINVK